MNSAENREYKSQIIKMEGETLEHVKIDDWDNYSTFNSVVGVIISLCLWTSLYKLLILVNHTKGCEWNFNIVAVCFSVLIVFMSFVCMLFFNPPLLTNVCRQPSNTAAIVTLCVSLGYFCYDTLWCILHWAEKKDIMNLIHHLVAIVLHCLTLFLGFAADLGTNVIFATEISTPLLLARWFMREKQMKTTLMYHINDFVFVGLFFIFRIFIGSWYIWTILLGCPVILAKIFLFGLYLMSLGYAVLLVRMLYFKIKTHDDDEDDRKQVPNENFTKPEVDVNLNPVEYA